MQAPMRLTRVLRWRRFTFDPFIAILYVTTCFICIMTVTCMKSPGETSPDIEMEVGTSANITCHITEGSSISIWFSEEETGKEIMQPSTRIIILDAQTAALTIRNASENMARYQCMMGKNAIGITKVYVGKPPSDVTDFTCRGYDFDYMVCSFTKPRNMINTIYDLKLKANLDNYSEQCTLQHVEDATYTCNISISSNTILISREIYQFNLTGMNSLGSRSQIFTINNYKTVVPAKLNVEIANVSSDSVSLIWRIKKFPFYNTYGLEYRISFQPRGFGWYNVTDFERCITANCSIRVTNLQYPYREYRVSVRAKVRAAKDDDAMWSEPFFGSFRTQPRVPDGPPKTTVGSFYFDSIETQVRLYWQQLAEFEENGPGFFYTINEVDMGGNVINTTKSFEPSVTFAWKHGNNYRYEIRAGNSLGQSVHSSQIQVSPVREEQFVPHTISTVYHNRTYTLSWKPPANQTQLVNYTVFWCVSKMESPNQCRGSINFKYLDKYATSFTTEPQDHTLNLAISANFRNAFTGMEWARCSADISSDLMKLEPEAVATSATAIRVQWNSETVCPSILQGYNLSYCQIATNSSSAEQLFTDCLTQNKTVVLLRGEVNIKEYTIEELKPYTQYRIEIFMYSKTKVGPKSNPILVKTKEAAPGAPRNLQLNDSSVTSNSASIFWLAPLQTNGIIQYYTIWRVRKNTEHKDSQKVHINETTGSTETPIFFEMKSLYSYTNYEVYVTAHTVECSERSNSIRFQTLISRPTSPRKVAVIDNGDYGVLKWYDPEMPSGRVEYYEVAMVAKRKDKDLSQYDENEKTVFVKDNFCKFKFPTCLDYYLKVRAVNVAERHEIDHGTFPSVKTNRGRRGRHTNPEISAGVGGNLQLYDSDLSRYNGSFLYSYERANLIKSFAETTQSTLQRETHVIRYDTLADNDFECVDAEPLEKFRKGSEEFTTLSSPWERTPFMYMRCSEYPLSNVVKIALCMLLLSAFLAAMSYWLRKKYNKMKDIDAVLPEELLDHLPNYQMEYSNSEKDSHNVSRSNDCLVSQMQSYQLLTTIQNSASKGVSSLSVISVEGLADISSFANVCSYSRDIPKDANTLEVNDVFNNNFASTATSTRIVTPAQGCISPDNGYIKQPYVYTSNSGVAEEADNKARHSTTNGYVQPNTLESVQTLQTASSGYTTPDAMGKTLLQTASVTTASPVSLVVNNMVHEPTTNSSKICSMEEENPEDLPNALISPSDANNSNKNNKNTICGYVTQKQLAEFGQLIH